MTNAKVALEESEVVRLVLQFFSAGRLHKSMRNLEKETGITNCNLSDDVLFLRQLILDGEWEAILTFAQPLESIEGFDVRKFRYLVLRQKFMEVLYFKSGVEGVSTSYSIEDLIKCLNQLEKDCPFKSDYTKLCWLLTVPDLSEQPEYRNWNPETARVQCFEEVLELLKHVMPVNKKTSSSTKKSVTPSNDRLINLIVKGLCFESCVEYCQQRAIDGDIEDDCNFSMRGDVLVGTSHESTGNFLSWLSNLPHDSFVVPFEPLSLDMEIKRLTRVKSFHFSNKKLKNEAESLSRSLTLNARPATADKVSHLSSVAMKMRNPSMVSEPEERSQSALPGLVKVSNSYNDFHYQESALHFQPIKTESIEASQEKPDGDKHSNGPAETKSIPSVGDSHESIINTNKQSAFVSDCHESLYNMKREQEQSVLQQLEEHEQQKLELQRQLMDIKTSSDVNNCVKETDSDVGRKQYEESRDTVTQGTCSKKETVHVHKEQRQPVQVIGTQSKQVQNGVNHNNRQSPEGLENGNMFTENVPGEEPSLEFDDGNFSISHPNYYAVTSTPISKRKPVPEPLVLDAEHKTENFQLEPITPGNPKFPKTPLTNILPPGHWVALADGSGILNTSTPKSCRNKMLETPAPLASPVLAEKQQLHEAAQGNADAPSAIPVGNDRTDGPAGNNRDLQRGKDKAELVSDVQDPPIRKGPKINGVRRSLVSNHPPMPRQKIGTPTNEPREAKTSRQEKGNQHNPQLKSSTPAAKPDRAQGDSSPRGSTVANQKQVAGKRQGVLDGAGVADNVQKTNGSTFVVDKDKPNKVPSNAINVTYNQHQPLPPDNKVPYGEQNKLMERQQECLQSSTEPMRFCAVATLEDVQAVRAVAFHPSGKMFAMGSNSKALRVCAATGLTMSQKVERHYLFRREQFLRAKLEGSCELISNSNLLAPQPTILFKRNRHHRGSIYCVAWNSSGDLIATGSNDKSIKVMHFDADNCTQVGPEMELNIHSGTIRDLSFVSRAGGSAVLVSGGAGDGNIQISDCSTGNTIGQLKGHSSHVMTVFAAKDDIIASGSNDNTVRLWDLRSQRCIDAIATGDSCVASVCVNPGGTLLASGHEDGGCMIYDITAGRTLQFFKPHTMDCRSVRFSQDGHYLLTGSYDTNIILMDMQQNLESCIPPYSVIAQHADKVIQCRWHPSLMAFVSSSADRTASLWTLDC